MLNGLALSDLADLLVCTTDAATSISFATPLNVASEGLRKLQRPGEVAPAARDGVIDQWALDRPALSDDVETLFKVRLRRDERR